MANRQRAVLLALAAVVAIAALVVVGGSGGDDEEGVIDTRTTPVETTGTDTHTITPTPTEPTEPPEPVIPTIVVHDGKPVGGVERLRFRKGGVIVFYVRSDTAGHAHLHGYDLLEDLVPGGRVKFDVAAKVDGSFELELEDTATLLAEIEVVP